MSIDLRIFFKDSEGSLLQPKYFAELIVASLKLPRRAMLKVQLYGQQNP
jgi:3-oxoacyl-[acyl-carrier protein] reductase